MSEQSKAFCPNCKKDVVFIKTERQSTCPECGFAYDISSPVGAVEESGGMGVLGVVIRTLLIMAAIVVIGLAVAFAGCVLALK